MAPASLGLILILGSGNYLKPNEPLAEVLVAFPYPGSWFLIARTVYSFGGIEAPGKQIGPAQ